MARLVRRQAEVGPLTLPEPVVEARQVFKRYTEGSGKVDALSDINLTVRAGEFVALMGPSGSGKSTLLHLIGGIDRPSDGEIVVQGVPLSELSAREAADYRNRQVGFVFQMLNLIPSLTVEENLWLPAAIAGMTRSWAFDRMTEVLTAVGVDDKRRRYPQELSGGEQQRVAIARAVLMRPALILADEPTGSLDAESSQRVVDLLLGLHREGQVIVLATHDPRIASLTDRVIYLRDGQVEQEFRLTVDSRSLPEDLDDLVPTRRVEPL